MALSDVMKKKQENTEGTTQAAKAATEKKNPLDDVRIVIAILVVACIALIALIVYTTGLINEKKEKIESVKVTYTENQKAIANLLALQAQSGAFKQQKEEYDRMISDEPIEKMQVFMDLEEEVDSYNCVITGDVEIEDPTNNGLVNQAAITMTIVGEYSDIVKYCQHVAYSDPIRRIDTIKVTPKDGNSTVKQAELVVVVFSKK